MGQIERIREAKLAAQRAAIQRWRERSGERSRNHQELAKGGPGAADSPMRKAKFAAREAAFSQARELRAMGRLPITLERKIGPTLDWTSNAPDSGAKAAGRPVARLVTLGGPNTQPEGFATGFLVSPRLILTNHHVFPDSAYAARSGANFLYEQTGGKLDNGVIFELDPDAFFYNFEGLDLALVAVRSRSTTQANDISEFGMLPLVEATPKILIGQPVNIIQHPDGGEKRYAIQENRLIDLLDSGFMTYETDTAEGSSGSPALSQDWQLVGLHHASIPEMDGDRVVAVGGGYWEPGMADDKVHWIANEGIRVSAIVKHLAGVKMNDPAKQSILNGLLATTTDPVDELLGGVRPPPGPGPLNATILPTSPTGSHNTFNFSGPVTINVYAPSTAAPVVLVPPLTTPATVAVEKVIQFDPDYDSREGYDPNFLDPNDPAFAVPAPTIDPARAAEILLGEDGNPLVLKYHHFELVMNRKRRLLMWSAGNVDYDAEVKSERDREAFGSDKWIPDPRIPAEAQIMDGQFYKPAGNIDRGHIVRREDNAWGDSEENIEFANSDTFHWTNCTPQHEAFNQSAPGKNDPTYKGMKGLWGDFENHVQFSLDGEDTRACILAGPVLSKQDPSRDFGFGKVKYPIRFWKVICVPITTDGARRLTAFGFMLSQRDVVEKFGIEVFRPGKFSKYQVPLADITKRTGVVFDPTLHAADPLAGGAEIEITGNESLRLRPTSSDGAPAARQRRDRTPKG